MDNIERGLEKAVRGVFTAGSRNRIEPVDLASRLRAEMDNKSYVIAEGRTLAPNVFTIEFSETDFPRAQDWGENLAEELCDVAIRHARSQGYTLRGAVRVTFTRSRTEDLRPGEFLVISTQERTPRNPARGRAGQGAEAPAPSTVSSPIAHQATHAPGSGTRGEDRGLREPAGYEAGVAPSAAPAAAAAASSTSLPTGSSRLTTPRARPGSGARREPAADLRPVLDINGQRFSLQAASIVLGRSSEADITIEDTGVSRRHLEILTQDGVHLAVDLGSTNGSTVDGTRLNGRRELVDGSVITMGRTKITFRLLAPRSSS
ncbi:FhaA domain-containing protein [Rothia halotolerans]|uniref:FhaA domain-containing protein n=1 Tax=Rothia halotolerans TaxID=405770 RepID=UPI00101CE8EB|nr:DUF3662 and FHA domain-containing protein [Rothia halotolerans]